MIEEFILHSTWPQGKWWLGRVSWFSIYGLSVWLSTRKKSLQYCLPAYLLATSRILALSGSLNFFTEERLRYYHVFIPSLQHTYDLQAGSTVQPKIQSRCSKKITAGVVGIILSCPAWTWENKVSLLLVTVLTKCYDTRNISRGKNQWPLSVPNRSLLP